MACAGQDKVLARLDELTAQVQGLQDRGNAPFTPCASKTLLVGASVLREIAPAGLQDTDVHSLSGYTLERLQAHLQDTDLSGYHTIVVQCSTNNKGPDEDYKVALDSLVDSVIERAPHAQLVLSGLCPRTDQEEGKVPGYNRVVCEVAEAHGLKHVANEASFKYQDGRLDHTLLQDRLHPNKRGTAILLRNIHSVVPILRSSSHDGSGGTSSAANPQWTAVKNKKQVNIHQGHPRSTAGPTTTQHGARGGYASTPRNGRNPGPHTQVRPPRQRPQQQQQQRQQQKHGQPSQVRQQQSPWPPRQGIPRASEVHPQQQGPPTRHPGKPHQHQKGKTPRQYTQGKQSYRLPGDTVMGLKTAQQPPRPRGCYNCAEEGHSQAKCHHETRVYCFVCGKEGHKAKFCYHA